MWGCVGECGERELAFATLASGCDRDVGAKLYRIDLTQYCRSRIYSTE